MQGFRLQNWGITRNSGRIKLTWDASKLLFMKLGVARFVSRLKKNTPRCIHSLECFFLAIIKINHSRMLIGCGLNKQEELPNFYCRTCVTIVTLNHSYCNNVSIWVSYSLFANYFYRWWLTFWTFHGVIPPIYYHHRFV